MTVTRLGDILSKIAISAGNLSIRPTEDRLLRIIVLPTNNQRLVPVPIVSHLREIFGRICRTLEGFTSFGTLFMYCGCDMFDDIRRSYPNYYIANFSVLYELEDHWFGRSDFYCISAYF